LNIIVTILLILAGIIVLVLLAGLFLRKRHFVKREIIIGAPVQKVYDYVKYLKNQETFNKGAMADENRQKEFKGIDGTVGFIYAWKGNKDAGEGEKEILKLVDGNKVESEIRFVKPMRVTARISMETEPITASQTKVSWTNSGILKYPLNILIPVMERHVKKDMDSSLISLKQILETNPQ
jgi:hypothetical protein